MDKAVEALREHLAELEYQYEKAHRVRVRLR